MSYYALGQTDKYCGNFAPYCLSYEKAAGHPYVPCNCNGHVEKEVENYTNRVYYEPPPRTTMERRRGVINEMKGREEGYKISTLYNTKINLFQTYHDKLLVPDKVYTNIRKYAPNYNHVIFDYTDCRRFIEKHYGNTGGLTWDSLKNPAHKADFWRYCILYIHGGLYLDIKVELIKPIDEIITDKKMVYTIICEKKFNYNNCIMQGIIYTPPRNPLFLKLINHCMHSSQNSKIPYHIFTSYFSKQIKENSMNKIQTLTPGLIEMKNMPQIYLFQEICTYNSDDCYDGLDKYGHCCFVYHNKKRIIKVRYSDYPWK